MRCFASDKNLLHESATLNKRGSIDQAKPQSFNIFDRPGIPDQQRKSDWETKLRQSKHMNPLAASVEAIEPALGLFSPFQKLTYTGKIANTSKRQSAAMLRRSSTSSKNSNSKSRW